jgi:subtilisin family serine protease
LGTPASPPTSRPYLGASRWASQGRKATPFLVEAAATGVRKLAVLGALLLLHWTPLAAAHQAEPTGAGVTIAILDTGVDSQHAELQGRVTRVSFAGGDVQPPIGLPGTVVPLDPDGQGTAVASVAAGDTLGVSPGARILDLQVSATSPTTPFDPATEAAAIDAMDYLLRNPNAADVALLSFAQDGVSDQGAATLTGQARALRDLGVLVVVPAGAGKLASAAHTMTVGGSEACATVPGARSLKPDLVAKSQGLQAADAYGPPAQNSETGTVTVSGTAYAAAQAAGTAALMLDERTTLPVDALAALLRASAQDRGDAGPDTCNGFGLLQPGVAVNATRAWEDPLAEQEGPGQDTPGPGAVLLLAVLATVAVLRRRPA